MIAKITKGINIFAKAVCGITFAAFMIMMILIVVDVCMRTITGSSLRGTYEIVERLLMTGVFASIAYTQTQHGHVHVTMLLSHLPEKVAFVINGIMSLLSTVVILLVLYASILQTQFSYSYHTVTGVLYIPLWPFYVVESIGMAIFAVTVLWDTVKNFIALKNKEVAEEIKATWD